MDIRTGFGYDIHRLIPSLKEHPLLLGGVEIPSEFSISSHSDGDIVFHALANAILSGLGLEDIGFYFPDTVGKTKDMPSSEILSFALDKMEEMGYEIGNAVVDIVLQKPHLSPYRDEIKESLGEALHLPKERIGLSFNTGEHLGVIGNSEGIVVYSNVLLRKD